jgi:cation diffusion facilitator family transporter
MSHHDHHDHHDHDVGHGHVHGAVDPSIFSSQRGIWAVKWSFVALLITAAFQLAIVGLTGSVALLADTIHNFGDAATAIPLWIAFRLGQRPPTKRFTYGYGRAEDLAGMVVVGIILFSAAIAGYEAIDRLLHPREVTNLWAVAAAAIVGFLGNEGVAVFRVRVGKEIGSAALVADGYHARADGLTSLAVLVGAVGVALGFPLADPLVGLAITVAILKIVWDSGKLVLTRLLDGIDPEVVDEIRHAIQHASGVSEVSDVRVRWLGHRMHAEVNLAVAPALSVEEGHAIAMEARHVLLHHLAYLSTATIHVDSTNHSGEAHHRVAEHQHDDLPVHAH